MSSKAKKSSKKVKSQKKNVSVVCKLLQALKKALKLK